MTWALQVTRGYALASLRYLDMSSHAHSSRDDDSDYSLPPSEPFPNHTSSPTHFHILPTIGSAERNGRSIRCSRAAPSGKQFCLFCHDLIGSFGQIEQSDFAGHQVNRTSPDAAVLGGTSGDSMTKKAVSDLVLACWVRLCSTARTLQGIGMTMASGSRTARIKAAIAASARDAQFQEGLSQIEQLCKEPGYPVPYMGDPGHALYVLQDVRQKLRDWEIRR